MCRSGSPALLIRHLADEQGTRGSPCLVAPAAQHLSALLPSEDSALRARSDTYAANTAVHLPATQALLPAVKNEGASSLGFAEGAADARKHCASVQEQRGPAAPSGKVTQETGVAPAQAEPSPTGRCSSESEPSVQASINRSRGGEQ